MTSGVITAGFDAAGQRTSVTDPLNRTTTTAYTNRGWVPSVTDPLGNQKTNSFDANGNLTGRTESGPGSPSSTIGNTFDALNRRTVFTNEMNQSTQFAFDGAGQLTSVTDPLAHASTRTYTARGWLSTYTTADPVGSGPLTAGTTTLGHDGAGNQTSVADPLNRVTTSQFDAQNRLTSSTDPRGAVTQLAFDAAGRRISLTDPVNNVTSWGFDATDRVISETDPLGNSRSYVWNAASEVTSYTDRNGRQTSLSYDNMGRKKTEQWLDGAGQPIHTISSTWDAASQLTNLSDAFSVYAFGYNAAGWLTSENNSGTPGMPQMTLTHGYDAFGMRTSLSDNLGGSTSITFNARHMWTGSTLTVGSSSAAVTATYDSADRLGRISRGQMGSQITTDLAYDDMDRVTRISHKNAQNQAISTFDYGYNSASEVTSYTGPEGSLAYSYDTAGELIGVSGARSESYSHDLNGNRTMAGYQTGTGNRLTSDGVFNYTFDNEGNLVTRVRISDGERTEFTWDHRNRMTQALVKNSAGTVLRDVRFTYDALDRPIGRWYDADGAGPGAATQRWTVFHGQNSYADFLGSTLDDRYLYGPAVDAVMARLASSGVGDWYLTDLLGSVRQIVNGMGMVQDAITYDSYGKILSETNPSAGDRFKFTAREWEAAIDQYFYRARWHDPAIGRFTSIDPIGFEAELGSKRHSPWLECHWCQQSAARQREQHGARHRNRRGGSPAWDRHLLRRLLCRAGRCKQRIYLRVDGVLPLPSECYTCSDAPGNLESRNVRHREGVRWLDPRSSGAILPGRILRQSRGFQSARWHDSETPCLDSAALYHCHTASATPCFPTKSARTVSTNTASTAARLPEILSAASVRCGTLRFASPFEAEHAGKRKRCERDNRVSTLSGILFVLQKGLQGGWSVS